MRSNSLIVLILVFLTALIYSGTLHFDFTSWDDNYYVVGNRFIKDFSWDGFVKLWTERTGLGGTRLTLTSFMIDYKLWGLNPAYYHAENVLWHIVNAILLFFLILKLTANRKLSFVTAVLFAVHPMHVESVAWISERKDVLYTFFLILCLHSYINYVRANKKLIKAIYWIVFMLCFYLSWHSKFSAVIIPALLFLIDYALQRKLSIWLIIEKIPLLWFTGSEVYRIAFGGSARMDFHGKKLVQSLHPTYKYSLYEKTLLASYSLLFYLYRFLLPVNLTAIIPYPVKVQGSFPSEYYLAFIICLLILAGIIIAFFRYKKKRKEYLFGFLFFLISISIFMHFVSIKGVVVVADRYTYVPYIGLSFIVGIFLSQIKPGKWQKIAWILFYSSVIVLSLLAYQRTKIWENDLTLFSDVLEKNPKVVEALNNRGNAYNGLGEFELAIEDFNAGIRLQPGYKYLYNNRAQSYHHIDSNHLALIDLDKAIELDPKFLDAYLNKAQLFMALGKTDKAIEAYSKAVSLAPFKAKIYLARADAYIKTGQKQDAMNDFGKAIEVFPDCFEAYYERGRLSVKANEFQNALADFQQAKRIHPSRAIVHNELGHTYNMLNDFRSAMTSLNLSIELNPALAESYNNRGITFFNLQQMEKALSDFSFAIELDSLLVKAYSNRGNYYAFSGDFSKAIEDYNIAIGLDSTDCISYVNRGNVHFENGDKTSACSDWLAAEECGFEAAEQMLKMYCK